ncbi:MULTISPECIES: hypothetical protein [Lelliottia]|uniref:Fimbrial protein n=1 Tax=Lelliottia aquatilis TaxID=2080838 RepID=A0ABX4ZXD2_9ENTR|nr:MULTISPECIES: hypothetical protein [Lelliottia]POZ16220.1 hypothetical protein C3708_20065 [Lelliottia sp. 7254-16]POZ20534.1 hypothetical protein C3712_18130 [Lelliottia aquatilis]POZ22041.1 hypothetical protein C3711_18875 [Lelliottia aquatilis]POZ33113.1 hypothetical protein C3710_10215 [Lelliottia aquatilis]POZ38253.1 hypothetical protein C3709_11990 [Lelliottia aquatilis]
MNTRVIAKNQRKTGALLAYLIAGAGFLSSVPALAAGAIYDAKVDTLTIKAIKAMTCSNKLTPTDVHLDAAGKVLDTSAGTVTVTCAGVGSGKVALAIAKSSTDHYAEKADGTPEAGAVGTLTLILGGGTATSLSTADNYSSTKNIDKMVVAAAKADAAQFTLTPSGTVTTAGNFTYSLASAVWVE